MKGTIKVIKEENVEILVQPDHGKSCIFVEKNSLELDILFSQDTDSRIKEMLTKNPPNEFVVAFVGDRISYKKDGTTYLVEKLIVSSSDPRNGHKMVKTE